MHTVINNMSHLITKKKRVNNTIVSLLVLFIYNSFIWINLLLVEPLLNKAISTNIKKFTLNCLLWTTTKFKNIKLA